MNLLVIGASGRTGREVLAQALGHGHHITAFVRDPSSLAALHERVHVVGGDVTDAAAVAAAVVGQDAVVSTIGAKPAGEVHTYSDGTANIIRAMTIHGVPRLVVVSSAGVGGEGEKLPVKYRLLIATPGMRGVYEDMGRMEWDVMLSDLDWTIVRPHRLIDGAQRGDYRVAEASVVPKGAEVSRADLAGLLLKCAETNHYSRKAVAVAY